MKTKIFNEGGIKMNTIFNVEEVAKYLNCSVSCIRSLVRNKSIPHFRIGYRLHFNKTSIDNWISNQESQNMQQEEYSTKVRNLY